MGGQTRAAQGNRLSCSVADACAAEMETETDGDGGRAPPPAPSPHAVATGAGAGARVAEMARNMERLLHVREALREFSGAAE